MYTRQRINTLLRAVSLYGVPTFKKKPERYDETKRVIIRFLNKLWGTRGKKFEITVYPIYRELEHKPTYIGLGFIINLPDSAWLCFEIPIPGFNNEIRWSYKFSLVGSQIEITE